MKSRSGVLLMCFSLVAAVPACVPVWSATLPDACGQDRVKFNVSSKKNPPVPGSPEAGSAQIVFVETFDHGAALCIDCAVTTRIGVDGKWVGADRGNSWLAYTIAPGEHHLCVDWQTEFRPLSTRPLVGLDSFVAVPGAVYYYKIRVVDLNTPDQPNYVALDLLPISEDEGKYLVKISPLSVATAKK